MPMELKLQMFVSHHEELNLCHLQEQQVILTPDPLLQSLQPSRKEASILANRK